MSSLKSSLKKHLKSSQFRLLQDIMYETHLQKESFLNAVVPSRISKRKEISKKTKIKLHWGCGGKRLNGWLNIDGWKNSAVDYVHDMRKSLPLADGSTSLIFTEHVLEHFTPADGLDILRDFHRILETGGRVRIIVPDVDIYANRTGVDDPRFQGTSWENLTRAESTNDVFYNHFHRTIYDASMLTKALTTAGFAAANVSQSSFRASGNDELNLDSDGADRLAVSLYVEAFK